ncbi:MAG: DNA repair protein RadC [Candidatus Latescibacteria bacterium]|nr:DNA repair protein RadC [Candidatus Latescibacterota bacterium]
MSEIRSQLGIKDWSEQDRPRERLLRFGAMSLTDSELLAILLRTGDATTGRNALDIARDLLNHFGGLRQMSTRDSQELCAIRGVGQVKASQMAAAIEIGRRLEAPDIDRIAFGSSTEVAQYYIPRFRDHRKEVFIVLLLDARNRLINEVTVSEGSLTASIVHPREVYKPAILESAASVIFMHNHPSGDPTPSQDDLKVTRQLVEAGRMIDIRVLDHIILGNTDFTSLAGKGLI